MNIDVWRLRLARHLWRRHPGVRSGDELTLGERAADRLRNGMGSWAFVFGALLFLAGWMVGNRNVGFDPYPFILLSLVLSCLAAIQGAILLIAARRSDQISAELASHDYADGVVDVILVKELPQPSVDSWQEVVLSNRQGSRGSMPGYSSFIWHRYWSRARIVLATSFRPHALHVIMPLSI